MENQETGIHSKFSETKEHGGWAPQNQATKFHIAQSKDSVVRMYIVSKAHVEG